MSKLKALWDSALPDIIAGLAVAAILGLLAFIAKPSTRRRLASGWTAARHGLALLARRFLLSATAFIGHHRTALLCTLLLLIGIFLGAVAATTMANRRASTATPDTRTVVGASTSTPALTPSSNDAAPTPALTESLPETATPTLKVTEAATVTSLTATGSPVAAPTSTPPSPDKLQADSHTGRLLYSFPHGNRDIYLVNSDGSELLQLTNNPAEDREPSWSPDGSWIVFWTDRDGNGEIYRMRPDGSELTNLTQTSANEYGPFVWSPDGSWIYYRQGNDVYRANSDGSAPHRLSGTLWDWTHYAFSPDGTSIAALICYGSSGVPGLYRVSPDGSARTLISSEVDCQHYSTPSWSHDGQHIAFVGFRDDKHDIFVVNPDGSGATRLTNTSTSEMAPKWSPDDSHLMFSMERDGNLDVFGLNIDGSGLTRLTTDERDDVFVDWSPDGEHIVVLRKSSNYKAQIVVMRADGSEQVTISSQLGDYGSPSWQPVDAAETEATP